jgi:hypothetical protein
MLSDLTDADFAARLHEKFLVDLGSSQLEIELIAADRIGPAPEGGRREPFSVVFRGPQEPLLPQRIYQLRHEGMGVLEVFLVPIGPDADGQRYELVFT